MKKPTNKATTQRPVHRLAGQWRAQNGETDADYTIEDSPSGICVSGLNTYAGRTVRNHECSIAITWCGVRHFYAVYGKAWTPCSFLRMKWTWLQHTFVLPASVG